MNNSTTFNRRNFIKLSSLGGVALALGFSNESHAENNLLNMSELVEGGIEINPLIIIEKTGKISIVNPMAEAGQGSLQATSAIVADELEVSLQDIHVLQAPGNGQKYGRQTAGGSGHVRTQYERYRKVGATVKEMLIKAASNKWNTSEDDCYAENGKIIQKSTKKSLAYHELVEDAGKLPVPSSPKLKDKKDFKFIGKALKKPDTPDKVVGKSVYGLDYEVPNMLVASVERCPVFGGSVESFDASAALKVKGVKHVLKVERKVGQYALPLEGVAVVADNFWAALKGRKALKINWKSAEFEKTSTENIYNEYRRLSKESEGLVDETKGDFEKVYAEATKKIEVEYEMPFMAHSPMEPQNAFVHVKTDGKVEVVAPSQSPDALNKLVADYLKIPVENVTSRITMIGGGFGRRLTQDPIIEAANLSNQLKAPIKIVWTREDDTMMGPYRPGGLVKSKASIDSNGKVSGLYHKLVAESIGVQTRGADKTKDKSTLSGISNVPYDIPNKVTKYVHSGTTVPVGPWRSVYASTNSFAFECFIDEIAHALGKDPIEYRLESLASQPKFVKVLELAKEKSNWNKQLPKGWGRGIAIVNSFGSYAAHVVEVEPNGNGGLKVNRVVCVIDNGITVNPDGVRSQTEGNIIMALTAAVKSQSTFEGGKSVQSNWHDFPLLRLSETPKMEIHIVESQDFIGGVGEPGLPPFAPALANAVFNATGKRIRKLPFDLDSLA